jgi:UDP-3-O-[3-hydroxymyristoyl] glucosamine N-acyltransferase
MKLGDLVKKLGGKLIQGNPETMLIAVEDLEAAGDMDLIFAEDAPTAARALASRAAAVVVKTGSFDPVAEEQHGQPIDHGVDRVMGVVESEHPRLWFARAARLLNPPPPPQGVHPTAIVGPLSEIGPEVSIGPNVVIGQVARIGRGTRIEAGVVIGSYVDIGENCVLHPRVTIYAGSSLGNRVVVHAGAVIGADGFGYVRDPATGAYTQFPQQGTLVIEDDVEIGANSTIDRGALKQTRIGRGTKIDNLVHVGHNCDIGEDVILVALTGISGSSTVGDGAVIAGQVGIGDHAHVGPGVILGGQAGVLSGKTVTNKGLKPGTVLWGTPARPLQQALREQATLTRLAKRRGKDPVKE